MTSDMSCGCKHHFNIVYLLFLFSLRFCANNNVQIRVKHNNGNLAAHLHSLNGITGNIADTSIWVRYVVHGLKFNDVLSAGYRKRISCVANAT